MISEQEKIFLILYKKYSGYLSLVIIICCLAVLAGWSNNIEMLKRIFPSMPAMNPLTAVVIMMLAAASYLYLIPGRISKAAIKVLLSLTIGVGLIKIIFYLFDFDSGIDHILFSSKLYNSLTGNTNSTSLLSAANFILIGTALIFSNSRSEKLDNVSQYLSVTVFLLSLLSIIGYIFGIKIFYEVFHFLPTALNTSILCMFLSFTVILLNPGKGMMELISSNSISGAMIRRLLPALVIVPIVLGMLKLYSEENSILSKEAATTLFVFLIILVPVIITWKNISLLYQTEKELNNAQANIADNEVRFRAVIENSNDSIFIKDLKGKYFMVNPACASIIGKPVEEIIGKTDKELFGEERGNEIAIYDNQVLSENKVLTYETNRIMGGISRYFNTTKFPYATENGAIIGTIGISRNITAAKESENELRKLSLVANNTTNGVIIIDRYGITEWVNDTYCKLSQYSKEELLGKPPGEVLWGPLTPEECKINLLDGLKTREPFTTETYNMKKDGTYFWVSVNLTPIFNSDGEIRQYIVIENDITERKSILQELENSYKYLNKILNTVSNPIFVKDREHRCTVVNDAFCEFVGSPRENFIGRSDYDNFPKQQADVFWAKDEEVFNSEEDNINEELITDSSGVKHIILTKKALLKLNNDKFIVGIVTDITELRNHEANIHNYNRSLTKINKELDQFAYIVSHDLKAPLRAIANLSEWIREDMGDALPEGIEEKLSLMHGRVNRMEGLINGILEYSRIGRENFETEKINLNDLVTEVIDSISPPANIKINVKSEMPVLNIKQVPIQQVFSNLINNAIKYNDKECGVIDVSYKKVPGFHEFSISDNGPGIPEEYHEKIFVIFQRLDARDKVEGTGIGLSLVKKIIEEGDGSIRVESAAGEGASFIFTVPENKNNYI